MICDESQFENNWNDLMSALVGSAVLYLMKFLSQIRDLISDFSHRHTPSGSRFPQMQEFLDWISDDGAYVLRKWP